MLSMGREDICTYAESYILTYLEHTICTDIYNIIPEYFSATSHWCQLSLDLSGGLGRKP
jgi:hypothetical protein